MSKTNEVDTLTPIVTVNELIEALQKQKDACGGDFRVSISIPYSDGFGIHYESIQNVTGHSGIIDIHTTVPDHDD